MGIGTASVTHQAKIQTSTANMFRLLDCPSSFTQRHITVHNRGPRRTKAVFGVRMDMRVERKLSDLWITESWSGRSGVLGSSETELLSIVVDGRRESKREKWVIIGHFLGRWVWLFIARFGQRESEERKMYIKKKRVDNFTFPFSILLSSRCLDVVTKRRIICLIHKLACN